MTIRRGAPYPVIVRLAIALLVVGACAACAPSGDGAPPHGTPRLPEGRAGEVLGRAIDAAGGWQRWQSLHDVGYVSMLTVLDPLRQVSSDSIGWFSAPLHDGVRARMDSLGLPTEVRFGIDGDQTWIVSDGRAVRSPNQLALTRFDMVSSLFWFSLPFSLAERPVTIAYAGEQRDDTRRWERLRVEFPDDGPDVPGPWLILYFDAETGLIDRVHGRLTAPFLRHELWVGQWLQYRDCAGIQKERQRRFFPADADGGIIGDMVAEQFVERISFNNGYSHDHFARPSMRESPAADETPTTPGDGAPTAVPARAAQAAVARSQGASRARWRWSAAP